MSDKPDTSREAVENMCANWGHDTYIAALLRALADERDALRADKADHARQRISCVRKGYARGWRDGRDAGCSVAERHRQEHGEAMAVEGITPEARMRARSGLSAARAISACIKRLEPPGQP